MRIVRFIITALLLGAATMATAQTGCTPVTLPWSEDFDSYGTGDTRMPPCWSATHNYDMGPRPHIDATEHYNGTASLMLYSGTLTGSHYSIAIGPEVDGDFTTGVFARFQLYAISTSIALEVGICDDTNRYTRNFVPLDTVHVDQGRHWKEVVIDLSTYSGTGRRIAFRMQRTLQAEPSSCYVDDLRIEGCGTTAPRVYHLTHNSLTVDWERYGIGPLTLEYNGQTLSDVVAPVTLTGLTPLTEYTLHVGCAGSIPQEVSATTLAGPSLTTTYYREALTLTVAGDSSLEVLPLPMEDIDLSQLTIALNLRGDTATRLLVGMMVYGGEVESFTPLDTLRPDGDWRRHTVSLAPYTGSGRYMALLATGQGTLQVNTLRVARCLIDSVRLYDLTDVSVTVAWDTLIPSTGSAVTIEYGPAGFAPGSGTVVTATTNPFLLGGLTSSTAYDLVVAPACGDSPSAYDRHSLVTFAHEVSVPYCLSFEEGDELPQGWVCSYGSAAFGTNAYEGSRSLHIAARSVVALPRITTEAGDSVLLEFYSYGSGQLEVGFVATPYTPFTPADTLTGGSGWQRQLRTLVIPEGQLLALRSTTAWDIDALAVHHDAVTSTAVDAIGKTSAHVSWQTLRGDSVRVEYRAVAAATDDFVPGTGTLLTALDSLTLTGLTPGTHYAVHLQPTTDGEGCLYQRCDLLTAADDITLPYCENFDDLNDIPASWRRLSDYGEYPIVSSERNRSPDKALRFSATVEARTVALLPDFVSSSDHLTLAFWTNTTLGADGALMIVGHLGDISRMESFVPSDTILLAQSEQWVHHIVDLGTAHGQVALMLVGGSDDETRVFVDDLCVEPCAIDRIRMSVDSTSLTVWWDNYGATAMDISVSGGGLTLRDTLFSSPGTLTGLTPGVPYTIAYRSLCACGDNGGAYLSRYGSTGIAGSDQCARSSFNTHSSFVSSPYCMGFESYSTGYYPYNWDRRRGSVIVSDRNYHSGSHSLIVNDSCYVVLPPMANLASQTLTLYGYASNEAGVGDGVLVAGVLKDLDSLEAFTPIDSLALTRPGEWQRLWADFGDYGGEGHYIVLKVKATDACTFFFDDFNVSPCAIGAAEVHGDGTVVWEGLHTPTKVAVEYGLQGFLRGSGQQDTSTTTSYTLQNIAAGENYDIYLTPVCGTVTNCNAIKVTLGAAASTPYCEQFESAPPSGMPSGWSMGRTYDGTPLIATDDGQSLLLRGHAATTHRSIAVLPLLASHDSLQLSMSLRAQGLNARLAVGHIGDNADPNTFVATDTLVPTVANGWQRLAALIDLPPQRRIALSCFSINQSTAQVWVDSLAVTRGLTPTLQATSARTLAVEGPSGFIEYGPQGFPQGSGTTAHLTEEGLTLSGLTPEAEYWFYTREDSLTLTCMPPARIRMPAEAALPYCHGDTTIERLSLPEMAIDSIRHLHLYFTLDGAAQIAVGVMEHDGDWEHLVTVDTVVVPAGIRQPFHIAFDSYHNSGRFVGLLSLSGNATLRGLTATACPWVTFEGCDDNSVLLVGNGDVEYGPAGFTPGSGTLVAVTDSLRLPLADTTQYDFYPFCSGDIPCYAPWQWKSSMTVTLPYCLSLASVLPDGWTPFSNALANNTVRMAADGLRLTAAPNRTVGVKLPLMTEHSVVVDLELLRSGNNVHLLAGDDTVMANAGSWQTVRVRTHHDGRLTLRAIGNGTVRVRSLVVSSCALPREVTVGQPGSHDVELSWDTTDADSPFFVEYRLAGSSEATIIRATASPIALQLLPDTSYLFTLSCDSAGATCRESFTVTTLSDPEGLPYCTSFTTNGIDQAPERWYLLRANGLTYLVMPQFDIATLQALNVLLTAQMHHEGQRVLLGTMRDAGDPETFDSLTEFTAEDNGLHHYFHALDHYFGNGRFLALRLDGDGTIQVTHLSVDSCAAYHFAMSETETDHIVLEWEQQGTPTVSVEYGPVGFAAGEGTVVSTTTSPLRIDSLAPLTDYAFFVSSRCDDSSCRAVIVDTFLTFTPKGGTGCIDYTDLHASYVSCKYGSFSNPTEFTGVIDYGYLSAASRHTVHFDTTERDARTGGLLRTIPAGEQASVRLGNWTANANPQAESITYALTVDTNDFTLLVLRYAAVLQDPEHSAALQPRFRLQILNQNNEIIDNCSAADFIANPSLAGSHGGWNLATNEVLWKDWTTVGVDLTAYAGQTIFIRLITNDCGEGSHFGYAYFTLGCSSKRMHTEGCSDVPSNRFTVPSGFNYRWYTNLDTTTISDSTSIWVPSDNNLIYYCQLSFIDNPDCNFTMSAFAGARYPLAIIDTAVTVTNCAFDLTVTNRSTISGDGINPIGTGEGCETGLWMLSDSTTSTATSLNFHLTDTGLFDITLVAGIADGKCIDTLHRTIHIVYPHPPVTLTGRGERCYNDPPEVLTLHDAALSDWDGHLLAVTPHGDTTLTVEAIDSNGCTHTLTHSLIVHPIYLFEDSAAACASNLSHSWRDTTLHFTFADSMVAATLHRKSLYGCDSTMTLTLSLWPAYDIHHRDTLCDNQTLPFFDTVLNTTGDYLHSDTTLQGCDSLVTLHLAVMPTYLLPDPLEACDSLRWQDGLLYTADTTGALHHLYSLYHCDSIIELDLQIHPSYHLSYTDSVCNSFPSYAWLDTLLTLNTVDSELSATLHRRTIHSCDSIHTLLLSLMPAHYIHHYDTLCHDSQQPFFDTTLATTGDYLHVDSTLFGCDSLVTMHLEIIPRVFSDDTIVVCDSMTWVNNITYRSDTAGVVDTLLTPRGCDSVVTLYLTVNHSIILPTTIDTFCQGSQYLFRDHILTEGGFYIDSLLTVKGCDSVMSLDLTRLATPQVSILYDYDCDSLHYHLEAQSDVPYLLWTSTPHDTLLDGHENDFLLDVYPKSRTTYTLYADYFADPHCPVTTTLTLAPATKPRARMRVNPMVLVLPETEFDAYDLSADYLERAWYVNGILQTESSRHLHADGATDGDTATVALFVGDGHCKDSTFTLIPLLYSTLIAPNAFTPGRDDNNLFRIRGVGILQAEVRIFNRHGMLVFYSTDFTEPWDGRNIAGEPCPTGNYVWHIRYVTVTRPGSFQEESGVVLLIR